MNNAKVGIRPQLIDPTTNELVMDHLFEQLTAEKGVRNKLSQSLGRFFKLPYDDFNDAFLKIATLNIRLRFVEISVKKEKYKNMSKYNNDKCRDSGLALTLILLIAVWGGRNPALAGPAIIVLVLVMTAPRLFKPLAILWFGLSELMSAVVSNILLTMVFFLVLTPIGLLRRWSGKDKMGLKEWKRNNSSAFVERNHHFSAADLEKPF